MEDLSTVFQPIKELLLTNKPLKDKDLMASDNPLTLKAEKSYPITLPDVTFTVGASAEMNIMLFNDEDDKDPDNLLSAGDTPLTFDTTSEAFLKYTNAVSAKANAPVSLSQIGFDLNLSASGKAKTLYYKKHSNSESINKAFLADIGSFKTIFRFADIENLEENDALAFNVNGTLTASVKVSWSNIFSQSLHSLTKSLPFPVTLDINLAPSLAAKFDVSVVDDFACFIKKEADGKCLVTVNKKKSSATSASADLSVGVKFSKQDELDKQLNDIYNKIIQSIFGYSVSEIKEAIEQYRQEIANISQQAIVRQLLIYFKLDKIPGAIDALFKKFISFEQEIPDTIEKIATANITFSFSYEYKRIAENTELLSVSINTNDLKKYHDQLLRFKPAGLLNDMRDNLIPFVLHSYLNTKTLTVSQSWGFGFKLFDVTLLMSKDYSDSKDSINTNVTGNKQMTFDRTSGYKWQLGKSRGSWLGDLSATMPKFSVSKTPTFKEFDFSLLLDTISQDPKMGLNDLRSHLDSGVLWGSILPGDTGRLLNKLANSGNIIGKQAIVESKLIVPDSAMKDLVHKIGANGWNSININYLSKAMAASMTYLDGYQLRANPAVRQKTYTALWQNFLNNYDPSTDPSDYAAQAESVINKLGNADHLAEFEADSSNWIFGDSFAGVIRSNPDLFDSFKNFIGKIAGLHNMIQSQSNADQNTFNKWLKGFNNIFSQSFYLRSLGCFLLLHAADLDITADLTKVFTLTVGSGEDADVINIAVM